MKSLRLIRLNLSEKLKDRAYRAQFFQGTAEDEIAEQIRSLRLKRKLRQVDVADTTGMKQSAISRLEQADYSKWNFMTLVRIANALDARIRIFLEPAEEAIAHYEQLETTTRDSERSGIEKARAQAPWGENIIRQREQEFRRYKSSSAETQMSPTRREQFLGRDASMSFSVRGSQ